MKFSNGKFMLETIKNKINSIFSKIFLLILAASFALWGVGDIFSSNNNSSVATVGKLDVTADDFVKTYQRIISDLNNNTIYTRDELDDLYDTLEEEEEEADY